MIKEKESFNGQTEKELLEKMESSLIFQFHQLHNTIFRVANKMIEASSVPIKIEQLPVLMCIYFFKGQTQQSVSELTNRDKSSVFRTSKILEKKGLLTYKKDPHDARRKIFVLTDTGKFVAVQVTSLIENIENKISNALTNLPKEEFLEELKTASEKMESLSNS